MRIFATILISSVLFTSCADREKISQAQPVAPTKDSLVPEIPVFFQVTSFLRGQIFELQNGGLTPIKFVTRDGKRDSSYLKIAGLEAEFADFLTPVIDSVNLAGLFTEKKFLDQTLNSVTLTYDPISTLPDSIQLRHWDVYIDPDNGLVKRIYLLKELPGKRTQQLTWAPGKSARNIIINEAGSKPVIEQQVEIKWDY